MSNVIKGEYIGDCCELKLKVEKLPTQSKAGRFVQNIRNCDIFIDDYFFLVYLDVQLYRFNSYRRFDMKGLRNICLNFNTKDSELKVTLPCLPLNQHQENSFHEKQSTEPTHSIRLWKLKRITDSCLIRIDDCIELMRPEGSYDYGFASKFRGNIKSCECDLNNVTRMPDPKQISPLQRTIDREIDEMKNFSRDQYKLNFVELQVPDGLDNPMQYVINFKDSCFDQEEEYILHNITYKPELMEMPEEYDTMEIDCGLISILLGICYDVRFTSNEPNCESGWTRSILSATLTYFEAFTSLKDVIITFMRRCLIYPLYRNYELSKQCVEDCVTALQSHSHWILKQLLVTRVIFSENERSIFNYYYIDDYIRYLKNESICSPSHLQMLGNNLKNVLYDVSKDKLGLGLQEIETELLKELITDIHFSLSTNEEESTEEDDFETDEDSMIDQKLCNLKLEDDSQ